MRSSLVRRASIPVLLHALLALCAGAAPKWRALAPEDFAAGASAIDPTAGAVILLRDIDIDCGGFSGSGYDEGEISYYVRIKVLDRKGIDALLQLQIPYEPNQAPRGLAARVVRPDGSIVEVERDGIYTRDMVRVGRESIRVKSFSFPALEPGCLIEYQYRVRPEGLLTSMQLPMSDTFPIALARVRLQPLSGTGFGTQMLWNGLPGMQQLEDKSHRAFTYEARDIPVAAEEPYSPPESHYKPWFSFYVTESNGSARDYWSYVAGDLAFGLAELLKPKKPLKEAAQRLTADIAGDEDRLQRLYDFCRTEIKNISSDTSGYTAEEIENLKPNRGPVDTLTRGYGTALDINILFGALLKARGADPSFAYLGDRSQFIFNWNLKLRAALPHIVVALPLGSDWRFYDPGALYLPCGELRWMNDGTSAIVIFGAKEKYWRMIEVPRSPPEYSVTRRTGTFQLDATGNLTGDVAIEAGGHDGIAAKHEYDVLTADQRRQAILDALVARLPGAEITDLVLENVTDPNQPIKIRYHVTVPGYAALTSGRMFLQPAFFQKGRPMVFTATERTNHLCFPYSYTELDVVTIDLPEGFELEAPRAPAPVNTRNLLFYSPRLEYRTSNRRLTLRREYTFEGADFIASGYDYVRSSLERVSTQDAHSVVLQRVASDAPAEPASER